MRLGFVVDFTNRIIIICCFSLLFNCFFVFGVTFSFASPLLTKSLLSGFGYNVLLSLIVFWVFATLSKVRLKHQQ